MSSEYLRWTSFVVIPRTERVLFFFFVMSSEATISDHPIETFVADAMTKRAAGTLALCVHDEMQ